jgi:2-oxoglutarate dehydrogenase E2 component (dihydrolipoamide succinyltransferase)
MDIPVVMPQMGESVAEGTVTKWLKRPGESVRRDEPLLEISTDKVDSEIPAPATGVVREIRVPEGKTVPVGEVLAFIEGQAGAVAGATLAGGPAARAAARGSPAPQAGAAGSAPASAATQAPAAGHAAAGARPSGGGSPTRFLSPLVQKMAAEAGIGAAELESIPGTGQGGRLRREDLEKYLQARGGGAAARPGVAAPPGAAAPASAGAPPGTAAPASAGARPEAAPQSPALVPAAAFTGQVEIVPMDAMRKAIAEHMVRSVRTSPHVTSITECDLTEIARFRERERGRLEKARGAKLTYMPFVARAVVQAIADFPWLNAEVEGERIKVKRFVNLGIAVALDGGGLIVPVVRDAHRKGFWDLAREIEELARRARERRLKPDEVHEGTFTITNPGVFGGLIGTPILNQPQVAILALGAVTKRPVVVGEDAIAVRSMMYLSLSYDHRIIDGAMGTKFLERLRQALERFDLSEAG